MISDYGPYDRTRFEAAEFYDKHWGKSEFRNGLGEAVPQWFQLSDEEKEKRLNDWARMTANLTSKMVAKRSEK